MKTALGIAIAIGAILGTSTVVQAGEGGCNRHKQQVMTQSSAKPAEVAPVAAVTPAPVVKAIAAATATMEVATIAAHSAVVAQ